MEWWVLLLWTTAVHCKDSPLMLDEYAARQTIKECKEFNTVKENPKFVEECGKQTTPNLKGLSLEVVQVQLSEAPGPLMCWSTLQSIEAACVKKSVVVLDPPNIKIDNFCLPASRAYKFPEKCDLPYCEVLKLVWDTVQKTDGSCTDICLKNGELSRACLYLDQAFAALFSDKTTPVVSVTTTASPTLNNENIELTTKGPTEGVSSPTAGSSPEKNETTPAAQKPADQAQKQEEGADKPGDSEIVDKADKSPADGEQTTTDIAKKPLEDVDVVDDEDKDSEEKLAEEEKIEEEPVYKGRPEDTMNTGVFSDDQSHFFTFFVLLSVVCILAYLVLHNKQKILALILEGRRKQGARRRSGGREYRKLDSSVEESIDIEREGTNRQVIY